MPVWNGKAPTRPGNRSKAESNSMVVGLGEGLPTKLWGGESAVDPKRWSGKDGSGNSGAVAGMAIITDCGTAAGWAMFVSMMSMSLWMKLHLNMNIEHMIDIFNNNFQPCQEGPQDFGWGVNAPLPPEAKIILKCWLRNGAFWSISEQICGQHIAVLYICLSWLLSKYNKHRKLLFLHVFAF